MAGRVYTVSLNNLSVTNDSDQDIFEIVNGSTVALELISFELYSATTSDERVRLRLIRRSTTGSAGAAATENALDGGNTTAAAAAVATLVTTPGTGGAELEAYYWSQLSPLICKPTPEEKVTVSPSGRLALNLQTAVASTRNWSGFVKWMEIG